MPSKEKAMCLHKHSLCYATSGVACLHVSFVCGQRTVPLHLPFSATLLSISNKAVGAGDSPRRVEDSDAEI